MRHTLTIKITFRLSILCALGICLWSFSRTSGISQNLNQSDKIIPITTHQLRPVNGLPIVDLRCETVPLAPPQTLRGVTCVLKNNAGQNVTAANLSYSILFNHIDSEHGERETSFLTLETLTGAEFQDLSSPLRPNKESVLGPVNIPYPDVMVKGIEVSVDYIEFEDKTTLGPDVEGSRIIADIRKGATKYKTWLTQAYIKHGKSEAAIVPLLRKDSSIPSDLELSSFYEETGAKQYRNRLRKKYQTLGAGSIQKHLHR